MLLGSLFIWGDRTYIGLLNKSVTGPGNSAPIGVTIICNKVRLMSLLLSKHFYWCTSQILCLLAPVHCSGGGMMKS